jgi:hypothetical protein
MRRFTPAHGFGGSGWLHLIGAVGGILLLEHSRSNRWLRFAGAMTATIGLYLLIK